MIAGAGTANRVVAYCSKNGLRRTLMLLLRGVFSPVCRQNRRLIWDACLRHPRTSSKWEAGEHLKILGPANLGTALTPQIIELLKQNAAIAEVDGVRHGDRLFVLESESGVPLAYSFIFFDTTAASRRQARILGEQRGTPIIGLSFCAPELRGRGLYRRILNEMFCFLESSGYERAICEVEPSNAPSNRASEAAGMKVCRQIQEWMVLNHIVLQRIWKADSKRWRLIWVQTGH